MKHPLFGISVIALISALLLPSCSKNEYIPMETSSKSINVEVECVGASGENLLADKSFTDKIKIVGESSRSDIRFAVRNNLLCFEADLPDRNDMKWSKDRSEATGMSGMTIYFGKQKASLKCFLKFTANRPPAVSGGTMILEEVEYRSHIYKRRGNVVFLKVVFDRDGRL